MSASSWGFKSPLRHRLIILEPNLINPIMSSDRLKNDGISVEEPKSDAIRPINAKRPCLTTFRLEFFRMQLRIKGIMAKKPLLFFCAFLYLERQACVAPLELAGEFDIPHSMVFYFLNSRKLSIFVSLPARISISALSRLLMKSSLNNPKLAATRSKRSASKLTETVLLFSLLEIFMLIFML